MLVLSCLPNAPWLPPGGRADVVLCEPGDPPPGATGLVRLLVIDADGRIFCVPRSGGRAGWDLPTAPVLGDDPAGALARLVDRVLGGAAETDVVGWVRNTVPAGTLYEWPSPVAHFVVHRVTGAPTPVVDGVWLDAQDAARELGERHWWPLIAVGRDDAARMTEALVTTWGLWLEGATEERNRDQVVTTATQALVLGLDTPALRELAGLYPDAEPTGIDDLVRQATTELGLPSPTRDVAVRTELRRLAREVVAGRADPGTLTVWAHLHVRHDGLEGWQALVRLDDEYAMLGAVPGRYEVPDRQEQVQALDHTVRAAAAAIVDGETDLCRFMPAHWR